MRKRNGLGAINLFKKRLIVEMDIDYLSKSLVFYKSININKNKIAPEFIDINFLYRLFMINSYLYFNAKIKRHNEKEGFCVIEIKMRDGMLSGIYFINAFLLILPLIAFIFLQIPYFFIPSLMLIAINIAYMQYLFTNSTTSLIKELKEIDPRYVKKYEEEIQRRKKPRRR